MPVREDLADYSWQELSLLGQAIGGASDDAQGEKIAQEYGLLESDGSLPHNASKQLELTDGTSISVRIAGIRHATRRYILFRLFIPWRRCYEFNAHKRWRME